MKNNILNIHHDETNPNNTIINMFGMITTYDYRDGEVSSDRLMQEISEINTKTITININSYGGEVDAAVAIYNALKLNKAKVIVNVAWACSSATIIMCAGDEVNVSKGSQIMIHDLTTYSNGATAEELKNQAKHLEDLKNSIIQIYQEKANLDEKTLSKMMSNETWIGSELAIEYGFADNLIEKMLEIDAVINQKITVVNGINFNYIDKNTKKVNNLSKIENKKANKMSQEEQKKIIENERKRVNEIHNMSKKFDISDEEIEKAVNNGVSAGDFAISLIQNSKIKTIEIEKEVIIENKNNDESQKMKDDAKELNKIDNNLQKPEEKEMTMAEAYKAQAMNFKNKGKK